MWKGTSVELNIDRIKSNFKKFKLKNMLKTFHMKMLWIK